MSNDDDRTAGRRPVEVELGGSRAQARVDTAHGQPPETGPAAAAARAWLAVAAQLQGGDDELSATAARRGLEALGDAYLPADDDAVVDDTELKVLAAGRAPSAAERSALLAHALEARLQTYEWRYQSVGLAFDPPLGPSGP